tara:strand:- start:491 stop:856 length:366 start_codon:yes stop_codon:yes gene_type:complete
MLLHCKVWFFCLAATNGFVHSTVPRLPLTARPGIFDAFKNEAFEDDTDKLSKKLVPVTIGTQIVQALPNQPLKKVVRAARAPIKFNCEDGKCGTCENRVDGRLARICTMSVPAKGCTITRK